MLKFLRPCSWGQPLAFQLPGIFCCVKAPKKASERSIFDAVEDTEAFVAANDDVVMAVFRGTMELTDWTTNLDFLPTRVPESWGLTGEGCDVHSVGNYLPARECYADHLCVDIFTGEKGG